MDDVEREALLLTLRALWLHAKHGGHVRVIEPAPRGRKGPDRAETRPVTLVVSEPARFDALRFELWRATR